MSVDLRIVFFLLFLNMSYQQHHIKKEKKEKEITCVVFLASSSYSKQAVEGGPNCEYQEHLFTVNQCYLLLHSRTFAAVTCSGSQIKGISHQRFPVVLQGPLFGCEASTCQFSGESEELLSTYEHLTAPIPVCV